ncbi:TDP-N-acetylfucosamine:lipid II N-acetylfucosaminyltransferase [Shewanella sp. 10N.286.48.B5]|uniref:TDP-N-acetylfucosamine:lipid II N-acetylfucosaminyltransferase n=1 Tax=Shewanella sp. 10N.286.48.B5 TaxID=1880834 RepID=UPI000C832E78|nr:TDP-N-acetylfucosamine:lipid II N-acetylfucosaminyltransferase [Shewanella sp. 10N.286.48.B5]PMH84220.1 hypothetical protein BCU57_18455 [Shewanella sp. 10N.286.48.B5]
MVRNKDSMAKVRVLHLAPDEKFIDMGLASFQRVGVANELIVFSDGKVKFVKHNCKVVLPLGSFDAELLKRRMTEFDIIIIHSMFTSRFCFPKSVKVVWVGFGFDYYPYICNSRNLLLNKTLNYVLEMKSFGRIPILKSDVQWLLLNLADRISFKFGVQKVISKVEYFCPVLVNEFSLIKIKNFPSKVVDWNYGTLEDDFIRGFEGLDIIGDNILLGNSASESNNHIEAIELIAEVKGFDVKVVAPLSYGNREYKEHICDFGKKKLSIDFIPLTDFMPIDDYIEVIQSCSVLIMNHLRQQALGNIIIGLFLGAKVFLQKRNPIFYYLTNLGFIIYSVDDVSTESLKSRLSYDEVSLNRRLLSSIWSRKVIDSKTKTLINTIIREVHS